MKTFCHSATKRGSKYGELMGWLSILVLSENCQRGSLLFLVLANSVIKTEVPNLEDPFTRQGCLDMKIDLSGHNFQQLNFPQRSGCPDMEQGCPDMVLCCPDTLSSKCIFATSQGPVRTCTYPIWTPCRFYAQNVFLSGPRSKILYLI